MRGCLAWRAPQQARLLEGVARGERLGSEGAAEVSGRALALKAELHRCGGRVRGCDACGGVMGVTRSPRPCSLGPVCL
jgi:hypothetical protein